MRKSIHVRSEKEIGRMRNAKSVKKNVMVGRCRSDTTKSHQLKHLSVESDN